MSKSIRKTIVVVVVAAVCVGIAVIVESGALSRSELDIGTMIFVASFVGVPVIHALIAHPSKMPFHWVFINFFFSIVGYAFFLFFLINRDKLGRTHSKYNQVMKEDADYNSSAS